MKYRKNVVGYLLGSLLILGWPGCAPSRKNLQLIYRDGAPEARPAPASARSVSVKWHPYRVSVIGSDGRHEWLAPERFWGYRQPDGQQYRLYQGNFYHVLQQDGVLIYVVTHYGDLSREDYYFSVTPDSEIWYLNRKNLEITFGHQPCFLDWIRQSHHRDWLRRSADGSYQLLKAYRQCRQTAGAGLE